jgi:5-methylcytosine-specific restriction endonuclease McrA
MTDNLIRKHTRAERQYAYENRMAFMSKLARRYGWVCLCCGWRDNLTLDHVVPISKGGDTVMSNLQILCYRCNKAKGDLTIDYRIGK